ncbi:MAG: dihydrodipicolinate synthase family protein [Nibricoccus sp.]
MQVAEAWVKQADEKLRVIVHVGHNCLIDAQELTRHAAKIGASAASAFAPCFFKPRDNDELVDWCRKLAGAAPGLPFYYYNIPSMTGVNLKVAPFLAKARRSDPEPRRCEVHLRRSRGLSGLRELRGRSLRHLVWP